MYSHHSLVGCDVVYLVDFLEQPEYFIIIISIFPEDGSCWFVKNVGACLPEYMASHARRHDFNFNLKTKDYSFPLHLT
jgi:hypothetical protein